MADLEILAPAGSMDALRAAVRSGADAVYLGAESFSARGNAQNFTREQLREAVEYCHLAGVSVHLAINTVLFDSELPKALELAQYACTLPVDAVIVQDWGLFHLLRTCAPTLPLHCSTQMSIHTPAGAKLMESLGASRVVLSRELSLREIKAISDETPVELEHFVHGALCMCVSGQCYFSAVLGSRSGNRGLCAQPCRLPFSAKGGTGYDLSLKDLSMISRIDALRQAGVYSCKIEGRMKRPEYVAAATAASRYAADGKPIPPELMKNLESVFSRSGFTSGYPDGKLGVEMFGTRTYDDVTSATKPVFTALQSLYQKERQSVPLSMAFTAKLDQRCTLTVSDGEHTVTASGAGAEPAISRPLDPERCRTQLEKNGGTVFFVKDYTADIGDNVSLPISALNELRRDALDQLSALRKTRAPIPFTPAVFNNSRRDCGKPTFRAVFSQVKTAEDIPQSARICERIFVPLSTKPEILKALLDRGLSLGVTVPRGMFGREQQVKERLEAVKEMGITHGRAGNIGGIALLKQLSMTPHGGFSLNVTNSQSLEFLRSLGAADTELSCELTLSQAAALTGELPRGLIAYGRLPLMLTRNCPAANHPDGCRGCENNGGTRPARIVDRKGVSFPIQCGWGCSTVLNSVPLVWNDKLEAIKGQDFLVFHFTVENSVETDEIFSAYQNSRTLKIPFTRGLYRRGVE